MQRWGATAVIAARLLPPTTHICPYTHESCRTPVQCLKRWKAQAAVFVTKAVIICSSPMNPLSVSLPSSPPVNSYQTSGELSLLCIYICLYIYCKLLNVKFFILCVTLCVSVSKHIKWISHLNLARSALHQCVRVKWVLDVLSFYHWLNGLTLHNIIYHYTLRPACKVRSSHKDSHLLRGDVILSTMISFTWYYISHIVIMNVI